MPLPDRAILVRELEEALEEATKADRGPISQETYVDRERAFGRLVAIVERIAPSGRYHFTRTREIREMVGIDASNGLAPMIGVVRSLRDEVAGGRTESLVELVHAEVFGDFLDMAKHLLDQSFKDAAAVIAGSSLESHLRALCVLNQISTDDAHGRPKKADTLNAELHKANVYGKGPLKSVVSWLDLRNDAAHGHYKKYEEPQVALMIDGIRDFIARHPA